MSQPTVLAIETATSACSAALHHAGEIGQRLEIGSNIHSKRLLSMVDELLRDADLNAGQLDAVAVGQGPGSFTGLRIGVGVAQGIAFAAGCPMVGVSSLAALAAQSRRDGVVLAGIDARMNEIYWGLYRKQEDQITLEGHHQVGPAVTIPLARADAIVGNAWQEYKSELDQQLLSDLQQENIIYPTAESLLKLSISNLEKGAGVPPAEFAPEYVRNSVAKKASER